MTDSEKQQEKVTWRVDMLVNGKWWVRRMADIEKAAVTDWLDACVYPTRLVRIVSREEVVETRTPEAK